MIKRPPQPWQSWRQQLSKLCLDLLFPPSCVSCQQPGYALCPTCAQNVEPVGSSICMRCGKVQPQPIATCAVCQRIVDMPLVFIRAAARYAGPLRQGIHNLKYENRPDLAPLLARYLAATFAQAPWAATHSQIDGVVPVPLHRERLAERGYNQSELLAAAFCRQMQLPFYPDWVERERPTRSQVGLNASERQANVDNAFIAHHQVADKVILLLDDVYTTGATLRACAAAALAVGATTVYGLALAAPMQSQEAMDGQTL